MRYLLTWLRDEDGTTAVEYAVMLAMILLALLGSVLALGQTNGSNWSGIQNNLEDHGFK